MNDPRECMFCGNGLPVVPDEPVNIAWLHHIDGNDGCRDAFDAWTENMQSDYVGY